MKRKELIEVALAAVVAVPTVILLLASRFAAEGKGLNPGQELPQAQLMRLDGQWVNTGSWRGSPTLLVLYRSTCRACEREILGLSSVALSIPRLRIVLLAMDLAAPRVPTEFPILIDPTDDFLKSVRKTIVPTLYLLDSEGRVR